MRGYFWIMLKILVLPLPGTLQPAIPLLVFFKIKNDIHEKLNLIFLINKNKKW